MADDVKEQGRELLGVARSLNDALIQMLTTLFQNRATVEQHHAQEQMQRDQMAAHLAVGGQRPRLV